MVRVVTHARTVTVEDTRSRVFEVPRGETRASTLSVCLAHRVLNVSVSCSTRGPANEPGETRWIPAPAHLRDSAGGFDPATFDKLSRVPHSSIDAHVTAMTATSRDPISAPVV